MKNNIPVSSCYVLAGIQPVKLSSYGLFGVENINFTAMEYNKYLDNYIKQNPIPITLLCRIKLYLMLERNLYFNYNIEIGKMDGEVKIFLN